MLSCSRSKDFETFESLERVNPLTAGRAHNEYLELTLEAGVFGIILVFVWVIFIGLLYARARKQSEGRTLERMPLACITAFFAIALQSIIDYPLRNLTMLAVAAALLGTMIMPSKNLQRSRD